MSIWDKLVALWGNYLSHPCLWQLVIQSILLALDMKVWVSRYKLYKYLFGATIPTFLGFMLLCFALVLEAHGAFIHLVCLNTKLAPEALCVICGWTEKVKRDEEIRDKTTGLLTRVYIPDKPESHVWNISWWPQECKYHPCKCSFDQILKTKRLMSAGQRMPARLDQPFWDSCFSVLAW